MAKSPQWTRSDIPDQSGRVAIVTGANSGIGFETVVALVEKGATVVMACRNQDKGKAAVDKVNRAGASGKAVLERLDLSDLASVSSFSQRFLDSHERLDLLINNAGVMMTPQAKTADGFELQFGTNHLGHFALTAALIGRLTETQESRVVTVASIAHKTGRIDFDDLMSEKRYKKMKAYGQSKLANLLFTRELNRRLAAADSATIATAAHPGWTATSLADETVFRRPTSILAQSPAMGALPTLYAATAPDVSGGSYFGPSGFMEFRGYPKAAKLAKHAQDDQVAAKLWTRSTELTGLTFAL